MATTQPSNDLTDLFIRAPTHVKRFEWDAKKFQVEYRRRSGHRTVRNKSAWWYFADNEKFTKLIDLMQYLYQAHQRHTPVSTTSPHTSLSVTTTTTTATNLQAPSTKTPTSPYRNFSTLAPTFDFLTPADSALCTKLYKDLKIVGVKKRTPAHQQSSASSSSSASSGSSSSSSGSGSSSVYEFYAGARKFPSTFYYLLLNLHSCCHFIELTQCILFDKNSF